MIGDEIADVGKRRVVETEDQSDVVNTSGDGWMARDLVQPRERCFRGLDTDAADEESRGRIAESSANLPGAGNVLSIAPIMVESARQVRVLDTPEDGHEYLFGQIQDVQVSDLVPGHVGDAASNRGLRSLQLDLVGLCPPYPLGKKAGRVIAGFRPPVRVEYFPHHCGPPWRVAEKHTEAFVALPNPLNVIARRVSKTLQLHQLQPVELDGRLLQLLVCSLEIAVGNAEGVVGSTGNRGGGHGGREAQREVGFPNLLRCLNGDVL